MEHFLEVKHKKHHHYLLLVKSNNIGSEPTLTPIPVQAWRMGWQTNNALAFLFFSLLQSNIVNHKEEKPLAEKVDPIVISCQ